MHVGPRPALLVASNLERGTPVSVGMAREVKAILKVLQREGCTVKTTGGGHWRVSRTGCQSITIAKTPSDGRTLKNIRADVRRYLGIDL